MLVGGNRITTLSIVIPLLIASFKNIEAFGCFAELINKTIFISKFPLAHNYFQTI